VVKATGNNSPSYNEAVPKAAISEPPERKRGETSLMRARLKELDREFARQTKQLTAMAKRLKKKLTDRYK